MKAVCHMMGTYNRDGQHPDVSKTQIVESLIANIGEYVQVGETDYYIQTVQNVFTKEDGQVRVYLMWENNDYELYIDDSRKMQMHQKSKIVTM